MSFTLTVMLKKCFAAGVLRSPLHGHGVDYAVVRDTQGGVARSTVGRAVDAFVKFLVSTYHKHVKFPKVNPNYNFQLWLQLSSCSTQLRVNRL